MVVNQLPIFEGYTVDIRLKQFRKINKKGIIFLDFNSEKGEKLLLKYIKTLDSESEEFKELVVF